MGNKMREVAALLGVEIDKDFNIIDDDLTWRITETGLEYLWINKWEKGNPKKLLRLLKGELEIKKKPWMPSSEEYYYIPCFSFRGGVGKQENDDNELMLCLYEKGFVCKTEEEAKELHDWIVEQVKRHRGIE